MTQKQRLPVSNPTGKGASSVLTRAVSICLAVSYPGEFWVGGGGLVGTPACFSIGLGGSCGQKTKCGSDSLQHEDIQLAPVTVRYLHKLNKNQRQRSLTMQRGVLAQVWRVVLVGVGSLWRCGGVCLLLPTALMVPLEGGREVNTDMTAAHA